MRQLEVPAHVHVCVDGDYVVFLDVRNDRYWALDAAGSQALACLVRGWPTNDSSQAAHARARSEPNAARPLIEKGLLCDPQESSKPATPIRVDPPTLELLDEAENAGRGKASALRFLVATTLATVALRHQSFERLIEGAHRRKQRRGASAGRLDVAKAARVVADFETWRPLLFSARDACLLSSLVLIEFLARHDVFPHWVFGVQARPFAAHCWIQHEDILFNDTIEHVRRYTPIMVI